MAGDRYRLVMGDKAWSTWSLRPWLLMRHFRIPFDEINIGLRLPGTVAAIAEWSPSGKIPVLIDGASTVWDSLAIAEYLADAHPGHAIWPAERTQRALARCVSAEMHAGFQPLRQNCPMDFNARSLVPAEPLAIKADVARITGLWTDCLQRSGGPFLFGAFCAADAMYAPVASRFTTYDLAAPGTVSRYGETMMALPAMAEWAQGAAHGLIRGAEPGFPPRKTADGVERGPTVAFHPPGS